MKVKSSIKIERVSAWFPAVIFLITLFSGILLARFLEQMGTTSLRLQSESAIAAISAGIRNDLQSSQAAGYAMSGSPWILPVLLEPSPVNLEHANSVLDRYNKSLGFSVCYLLDLKGDTIASSNRKDSDSFVGQNYAFRPYFQKAVEGDSLVYMATGVTSGERGFYASHPVKDDQGKIVGVSVIKKNVESAKGVLAGFPNTFFISPEGVIFISGSHSRVLRPLWPLSGRQLHRVEDSKQFELVSTEPLFHRFIQDGQTVRLDGEFFKMIQRQLGPQGWSLVFLAPLRSVFFYKFLGWLVVGFVSVIIALLTLWAFLRVKTKEALRESEERFASAFKASGIGMALVSPEGRLLQVNAAFCKMLGYSEKELSQKTFQEITCSEDLEKDLIHVRRLLAGDLLDYRIEKRYVHKNGGRVWAFLSVSLVRDKQGAPLYFVSQIEDISSRKAAEEKLQEKMKELEKFNKIAVDRELRMIELKQKIKDLEKGTA